MGEPPPNPDPSQTRRASQGSERARSQEYSQPLFSIPEDGLNRPPPQRGSRSGQGSQDLQGTGLPHWPQRSSLVPDVQGDEGTDYYQSMSLGYTPGLPMEFSQQGYLDDSRMMEQFPQGEGLLEQLESTYQGSASGILGQLNLYPREDETFSQDTQHGPYLRDDPSLHFRSSDLGFMPIVGEVPDPEPRELAIQNAKAYLLQTSVSCNLSL